MTHYATKWPSLSILRRRYIHTSEMDFKIPPQMTKKNIFAIKKRQLTMRLINSRKNYESIDDRVRFSIPTSTGEFARYSSNDQGPLSTTATVKLEPRNELRFRVMTRRPSCCSKPPLPVIRSFSRDRWKRFAVLQKR